MISYLFNINRLFLLISLVAASCSFAQDTTLVKKKSGWALKVASPVFIPTTKNYIYEDDQGDYEIFDGYKYSFDVKPLLTFGVSIDVIRYNILLIRKSSRILLNYGIGYKQSFGRVNYTGYYSGGISGSGGEETGSRAFRLHYAQPQIGLFYIHELKSRKSSILNSLSISLDYLIRTNIQTKFNGDQENSSYSHYRFWALHKFDYTPKLNINYELGWTFALNNKWSITPTIKTAILNINQFLKKRPVYPGVTTFENAKQNYSKEVVVGIIIMYNR